ncbi:MAG TPA: class F sortase [Candidatus Saccharimonadales bacterium]|nr:class F sortase [Candidatus Saccharimonadales bacterium]
MDRGRITLDNAVFQGRLKKPDARPDGYVRRPTPRPIRRMDDVHQPHLKQTYKKTSYAYEPVAASHKTEDTVHKSVEKTYELPSPAFDHPASRREVPKQAVRRRSEMRLRFPSPPNITLSKSYVLVFVASLLAATGVYAGIRSGKEKDKPVVAAYSTQLSNAQAPTQSQIASYSVPINLPRLLDISFIGVQARVFQASLSSDGSLALPPSIYDTAWYVSSARPGQPGAMVVEGHTLSGASKGVFYNLGQIVKGNVITVTRGDGKSFNYEVVKTEIVKASSVDINDLRMSQVAAKPGLNLITCAGDTLPGIAGSDKRIIVYSVLE